MTRTGLIRLGGLVTIVGGVAYATLGLMTWLCTPNCPRSSGYVELAFFVLLVFGAMVALASLHAIQWHRYGLLGTLAFLVAFVGVAMMFVSEFRSLIMALWQGSPGAGGVSWLFIIGLLVATVGLIAYGVTTITASALPWWCGLALIAGSPFVGLFLYLFSPVEDSLLGVPWVLVGFGIFRAATHLPEHPSRVR
jgi:Ca2+/Na+ antiporter